VTRLCRNQACPVVVLLLVTAATAAAQTIAVEPEREQWNRVVDIVAAMAIRPGAVVADVGAGDGFLTVRLAPIVAPTGKVYAEDIADRPLERLRARVSDAHLDNVVVLKGDPDDPKLPAQALDAVVILNSYHEMLRADDMLRHIRESLKPGGRLVIAEPSPPATETSRADQVAKHHISAAFVADEMTRAGFTVLDQREPFARLPGGDGTYSLVVGEKPR
jgi:predicted methyltransferase